MTGLIASPALPASPPGAAVEADGWFPAISSADLRRRLRLGDGAVTEDRLVQAIEGGMLTALRQLADWRMSFAGQGIADLAALAPASMLNNRPMAVVLWERIVGFLAAAELAEFHRDLTATDDGRDRAERQAEIADDLHRRAWAAIADLKSIGSVAPFARNQVSLI